MKTIEPTAIRSVGFYVSVTEHGQPSGTCDRCGQGIKYVYPVTLKDGSTFNYGCECVEQVLSGDTSLRTLWRKNAKLLQNLKRDLEILNRPWDQIPVGKKAINDDGQTRFISHEDNGVWMSYGHMAFHPLYHKAEFSGKPLYQYANDTGRFDTLEEWNKQCTATIEKFKAHISKEIARIESFLARILAKGLMKTN